MVVAALVGAGAAVPASGQSPDPLELVRRASARYEASNTLCADFVQQLKIELLGQETTGSGRLCQEQPDKFAMRFDDPEGDAVVADGEWVWVYYPSTDPDVVIRFPMAGSAGGFDFHREFLENTEERFEVGYEGSEAVAGASMHRIRLVPRDAGATYRAAEVWIDEEHALRRIRIEEENGTVRLVSLDRVSVGAAVPEGWFEFVPPPGTQILSR